MNKYNWDDIQRFYDEGHSWRDINKAFGVTNRAIQSAIARGALKTSRTISDGIKLHIKKHGPNKMGQLARDKLSKEQSLMNRGGKSKWFEVNGIKVQGTWEYNIALKFEELNISWQKPKTNNDVWLYLKDGKIKSYSPDFYLPEFDVFIEIKGHWWGDDREKMRIVKETYPDRKIIIVEKEEYLQCLEI